MDAEIARIAETVDGIVRHEATERARREQEREAAKQRNRARYPEWGIDLDRLARFSPRTIWAEQRGEFIGKRDQWSAA